MEKMFKWCLDQLCVRTAAQFSENNEFHDATMLSNKNEAHEGKKFGRIADQSTSPKI